VNRRWVINASPLIALANLSHLFLLPDLCSDIVIPAGVTQEIERGTSEDPSKRWLQTAGNRWIKDIGRVDPVVAAWDLGLGESHVISWAYNNPMYEAILTIKPHENVQHP
jgi:predicted nucleic acid-binding protein